MLTIYKVLPMIHNFDLDACLWLAARKHYNRRENKFIIKGRAWLDKRQDFAGVNFIQLLIF